MQDSNRVLVNFYQTISLEKLSLSHTAHNDSLQYDLTNTPLSTRKLLFSRGSKLDILHNLFIYLFGVLLHRVLIKMHIW